MTIRMGYAKIDRLETQRLLLRPINNTDVKALYAYRSDKILNQYQGWIPEKISDATEFIGRQAPNWNLPDTWFQLAIIEQSSEKMIGDIGVHFIDQEDKQVELGCTLAKENQGKGFATEALNAVIDFLFVEMNKHRIIASVDPRNSGSIAMLDRIGFRKEAHFKGSYFQNGEWLDDAIYALLKNEWKNNSPSAASTILL